MVKVTVSLGSSRPGGLDIALRGLAEQTYQDFEIVFTDARYHKRHAQVLDYVKQLGIKQPFYHVPNHRFNEEWPTSCAGVNTGFMLAEGEIVIMLLDYAYCPPKWIESHLKHHDEKRAVMAPHVYCEMPRVVTKSGRMPMTFYHKDPWATVENIVAQREDFDEISIFEKPFEPSWMETLKQDQPPDQDPKVSQPEGPSSYDYMHTKNESFPLEAVLDIQGIDENFDRGGGPGDLLFGWQLQAWGCQLWICQDARAYVLNPRLLLPSVRMVFHGRETVAAPGRWSYNDGEGYFHAKMASGDFMSNNPYDMREKRKQLLAWKELSLEREPVIPRIEISDAKYYRGVATSTATATTATLSAPLASLNPPRTKNALITGGTRGIGLAVAVKLARQGIRPYLCSRNEASIIEALKVFPSIDPSISQDVYANGTVCDVLDDDEIEAAVAAMVERFGSVDILVNNVGGGGRWGSDFFDTRKLVYEDVFQKNAGAMVRFTQLCVPFMMKANWGRVVTVSSIYGKEAGGKPWFNMAKASEISFMKSLSQDKNLVRRNITFNTVCPGHVSVAGKPDEEDLERLPLGRMGRPEEVASVVGYLCSEEAAFVNGATITVDGGESNSF